MSSIKGIENGRAAFAYKKVSEAIRNEESVKKEEYKSYVSKAPMLIKVNGLGNTIAFIKSKKNSSYKLIYKQVSEWLNNESLIESKKDLLEQILNMNSQKYKRVTLELLSLFKWLKRISEGLIEGESNE